MQEIEGEEESLLESMGGGMTRLTSVPAKPKELIKMRYIYFIFNASWYFCFNLILVGVCFCFSVNLFEIVNFMCPDILSIKFIWNC